MRRWGIVKRLASAAGQWEAATSSLPRSSSLNVTSRLVRASSSSSSSSPSSSSTSFVGHGKRTAMSDAQRAVDRRSHLMVASDRGAYDERTIPHVSGYDVRRLAVVENGKHVEVTWDDGKVSRFHSLWLRHTCFCPDCKFDGNGQPKMAFDLIPSDLVVDTAVDDGEGCLVVQWSGEGAHTGIFPLKFLKFHCYSPESIKQLGETTRMQFTTDTTIPEVTYEEVMESDEGLLKWMTIVNERGICMVKGVPTEPGMGRKVCERITRSVIPTIYGFIEDVKSSPVPINAGYSTDELKLHQDLVYYASPPGMQALFCLKFDPNIEGGESVFADLFHVAETFREQHPEDFNVLATVPATLDTIHYRRAFPVHMNVKRPMFTLNDHGDLVGVRYQPHHLGPLHVSEELIEPFYRAYKKFYIMTNTWPHKMKYRLQPGDMASYNNRRVAHGRTSYVHKAGQERHLQGCYVNVSELKSCMQTLTNLCGDGHIVKRIGDYDFM